MANPRRATYHRQLGAARLAGNVLDAAVRLLSWSFFGEAVAKLIYGRQLPSLMIGFKTVGLNMLIWVLIVELGVWLAVSRRITQLWKLAAILVGTMAAWVLLHMGATWYFLKYCFTYGTGAKPWPNIAVMIITGLFAVGFYLAGRFVRVSAPES